MLVLQETIAVRLCARIDSRCLMFQRRDNLEEDGSVHHLRGSEFGDSIRKSWNISGVEIRLIV